jgi:hypothetical protein
MCQPVIRSDSAQKVLGDRVDANGLSYKWLWKALAGDEQWHYAQFLLGFIKPDILREDALGLKVSSESGPSV